MKGMTGAEEDRRDVVLLGIFFTSNRLDPVARLIRL